MWESNPPRTLLGPHTGFEARQDSPEPIRSRVFLFLTTKYEGRRKTSICSAPCESFSESGLVDTEPPLCGKGSSLPVDICGSADLVITSLGHSHGVAGAASSEAELTQIALFRNHDFAVIIYHLQFAGGVLSILQHVFDIHPAGFRL